MAQKRRTCLTCSTYDHEQNRCRVGKANPRKKHESQTVAELMGVQTLCIHNPFREPLILRMRFNKRRFIWDDLPRPGRTNPIEVEIIEENEETVNA
jgi:hypothetical protein